MLTRSQTAVVNNFFQSEEADSMVLRNGVIVGSATRRSTKVARRPESLFTIVRTRSQTKRLEKVDIDFDEASREWRKNKRSTGNGTYAYKPAAVSL